jgi:hypothetical protein
MYGIGLHIGSGQTENIRLILAIKLRKTGLAHYVH